MIVATLREGSNLVEEICYVGFILAGSYYFNGIDPEPTLPNAEVAKKGKVGQAV